MCCLKITDAAKEYILKKGGNIYIKYHDIRNSCIEPNLTPEVFIGIPSNPEKYYVIGVDKINVYVDGIIYEQELENLTIELKSFLGIKYLVVSGWKVI
ncbi:MAG: CC/Se motif family (seleno)protein [Caldanaerobacter sp.]|uniref:CC/Se motif family (seleno)protein n=1 Tax=Caldanaerobacter sp. TaxID=2930036 RepID=UPI003C736629